MYYYKKVNEADEVEYIERCVYKKTELEMNLVEISQSEYEKLLAVMYKAPEKTQKRRYRLFGH